jgi:hypothetical protein
MNMVKSVRSEVESEVLQQLVQAASSYHPSQFKQHRILQGNKWLAASCLQKSIRRGLVDTAHSAAAALHRIDPEYALTRLGIIAYEDIGMANPELCGKVLLGKRKAVRKQAGEMQLLHYLVEQCAVSVKDRTATDLLCLTIYDKHVDQLEHQCRTSSPVQLAEIALDESLPLAHRASASKCLAGYRKFDEGRYEVLSAPRMTYLMDVCEALGVPPVVQYLVQAGHNKTSYLNTILPLVHQLISNSPSLTVVEDNIATPLVGGIPAATFDKYTQTGKQAMAYFAKACTPVRQFFERHPDIKPVPVLGMLLFHIEGSLLDRSINFAGRGGILEEIESAEMAAYGMTDTLLVAELRELVQNNMDALNHARRKVLGGAQ